MGHDLLSLLVEKGGTCPVEDLRLASAAAHGPSAVYCNCGGDRFDFDGVLGFLTRAGKVRVDDGVILLRTLAACQN
jgi:probable metal-binding protein